MDIKEISKNIRHLEISTNRRVNEVFAGNYKSSFKGQGLEVNDLRKYEEGDDVRHIDWLVTAKQGKPYIKKFQETRELTVLFLLDVSASMQFTTGDKKKSQVALEAMAYILFSAFKSGDKFGIILFADEVYRYIPPQKGKRQLLLILRETIEAFEINKNKKTNLKEALDFLNRAVKKRTVVFLLTDEVNSLVKGGRKSLRSLKIANKKHDLVYLKIFDTFEREIKNNYSSLLMRDMETNKKSIFNFKNKKFIEAYNKIRKEKEIEEKKVVSKSNIDSLFLETSADIYKELLLFFRRRSLKQ